MNKFLILWVILKFSPFVQSGELQLPWLYRRCSTLGHPLRGGAWYPLSVRGGPENFLSTPMEPWHGFLKCFNMFSECLLQTFIKTHYNLIEMNYLVYLNALFSVYLLGKHAGFRFSSLNYWKISIWESTQVSIHRNDLIPQVTLWLGPRIYCGNFSYA